MSTSRNVVVLLCLLAFTLHLHADAPVASYVFPAGGQRGKTVSIHVGGLNLHQSCSLEMSGPGVTASDKLTRTKTVWFEGPRILMPDSQRKEDYPKDMRGEVKIDANAMLGVRHWRVWTSQGVTASRKFIIGDLPEIVEHEIDGDPIPVAVQMPLTINGRIFPREDVDVWTIDVKKGQTITCEVNATRLGSPLDARLEVRDPHGKRIAEKDDGIGTDTLLHFTASISGKHQIRIHDVTFQGSQSHVYRLTLTSGPYVERVYPLGGRRGSNVQLELSGQNVPGITKLSIPKDASQDYSSFVKVNGANTNSFFLDVDELPEHLESPNKRTVTLPAILNGRIEKPGEVDQWKFTAKKGEKWHFDLQAAQLGSPLNGRIVIVDPDGKQVTKPGKPGSDPEVTFSAKADGTYTIGIDDHFPTEGSKAHAYRLKITQPPAPDFRLTFPEDALTLERGSSAKLKINVERLSGFSDAIELKIPALPKGVTVKGTTIPAKKTTANLTFHAEENVEIQIARLRIEGAAKINDKDVTRIASTPTLRGESALNTLFLAITIPTPFKIVGDYVVRLVPRGTVYKRHYRIERNGYQGELKILLADRQIRHLQGVTGPVITLPADKSEFDYPLHLPTWMELGRTCRACVMAVGVVKDEAGNEHVVNTTVSNANDQIILVAEPGPLSIEVDQKSIRVVPGTSVKVPVRLKRQRSLKGAAKVELITASHVQGISAKPLMLEEDKGTFVLHFAKELPCELNFPLVLRATVMRDGLPVIAETKLELVETGN